MTALTEQLEQVISAIRQRVSEVSPNAVSRFCDLNSNTVRNFRDGKNVLVGNLFALANYVDANPKQEPNSHDSQS